VARMVTRPAWRHCTTEALVRSELAIR